MTDPADILPDESPDALIATDPEGRVLRWSAGAARFLFRPIDPDVLLQEIETCLSRSEK